ncbi:MAG: RDD family protein [Acidobacteriota bacterium]
MKFFDADSLIDGTRARQDEAQISYGRDASFRAPITRPELNRDQQSESSATPTRRSSNNIVEAALTRVKRASENASRAALPKIEPARSVQATTQVSLAVDRQATARALDPAPEIESRADFTPAPRPEVVQSPIVKPVRVETSFREKRRVEPTVIADSTKSQTSIIANAPEPAPKFVLDEIEPLDYLEAEVRKVDKALGAEFLRNESPSIFTHAVIGVVDLLALTLTCSLFLAFIRIADGSFSTTQTRLASAAIVALISFFYLALTQCLCGRTFGMMLTNTRVVDALTFDAPSPSQALVRTAGYFVAAAPALAGIFWAALNRRHRGWQDFLSGTVVVRDF